MELSKFNEHLKEAVLDPSVTLTLLTPTPAPFPYYDVKSQASHMSVAYVARVKETTATGDITEHTVAVAYVLKDGGEEDWGVWCSDKFIEGRAMTLAEAKERCEQAVGSLPNRASVVDQMMKHFKTQKESDRCDFWKNFRRDQTLCVHTKAVLAHLRDNVTDLQNTMVGAYQAATNGAVASEPIGDTYSLAELAFKVPVLFEGDRGAGKTVEARQFCRTNNYNRVEFGGHAGIEAPDMLGYLVPWGKDTMVWKDGPLAEAFRKGRKAKTVLIIDELLRIPERELSILLTALSPDHGVYRLRTGRVTEVVDGVAQEEELECPVENLCVIGTTNVGSEYAVDEIDAALAERFVTIRKDTNLEQLKTILKFWVTEKKFPQKVAANCTNFFLKMVEARNRGLVARTPTTRTLVRAIELATTVDDVRRLVNSQVLLWVARTSEGYPVPEQMTDVKKIIEKCFISTK